MKNVKSRKISTKVKKYLLTGGLLTTVLFLSGCMRFNQETGEPQGFLSEIIYDFLIVPLGGFLDVLADFLGSYGFAIIVFAILFRLILLPLTLRQQKSTVESQVKMQGVQPVAQEIQAEMKETDDQSEQQALQMELMDLYRENDISIGGQLTGCLPLLLQMPIFIAMLQVLRQSEAIANSVFLGVNLGETSIVFAVVTALIYLVQSRMMTSNMPSDQQSAGAMMYIMPVMMLIIGISSPAGISLYWMISGVFTLLQQAFNQYYYKPKIEAEVKEKMGDVETVERKRKPRKEAPNASEETTQKDRNQNRNRNAGVQQRNRRNRNSQNNQNKNQ